MVKCKEGFREEGNKCVSIARAIASAGGILKENRYVRYLILVVAVILAFVFVVVPDSRTPVAISFIFLGVSYAIYSTKEYQDDLIGFNPRTALPNFAYALVFIAGFYIITSFVPFFSLAYPRFPGAIGQGLRWFLICFVTPIVETLFFQSVIFAFFSNFSKNHKYIFIIVASFCFSIFHLASYILGFYQLDIVQGWTAFTSNISAFITAFLFSLTAMIFALRKGVEKANVTFIIVFHAGLNIIAFGLAVITFIYVLPLIINLL